MGTRGAIGFRIDGQDKVAYNHFDSYPDYLGERAVEFARSIAGDISTAAEKARRLTAVDTGRKPTTDQIAACTAAGTVDLTVSQRSTDDWYCLMRGAQGDFGKMLDMGIYKDAASFLADSLFCEYAYLINFDTGELEFYRGFNHEPTAAGRYASLRDKPDANYAGVVLVGSCPIGSIPDDWALKFFGRDEDDEAEQSAA